MAARTNLPLIDGRRLWDSLMASGRIGPGKAGGLRRVALSDADGEMRDLYRRWCEEAGLTVTVDAMGSMFARRAGREDDLPPVLVGSHLDTQVAGGKYDGILGVLGGLEIARTLNDHGIETRRPIEIVNWTNEEGARFNPPMVASGVFAGVFELDWALDRCDDDGIVFGEELKRLGYAGAAPVGGREVDSYFELHIEQDDALERLGIPLGIVTGGYAARGFNVRFEGETAHTGPTPMAKRRNALVGAARILTAVDDIGWKYAPEGKATAARCVAWPNRLGILSEWAEVTIDFRHPDPAVTAKMVEEGMAALAAAAEKARCGYEILQRWSFGDETFSEELIGLVREAAGALGVASHDMFSQAGHDAYYMSRVAPTCLLFSPCRDGITHNEAEEIELSYTEPSVNVLLHAVLARANR